MNQSKLPYVILGLLAQQPLSGYDLKKRVEVSVGNFIKASYGNIYPTLKKLETNQEIELYDKSTIHQKKRYQITKQGFHHLKTWLTSKLEEEDVFLLRVYFFGFISKNERLNVIQDYDHLLDQISKRFQKIDETYQTVMGEYPYETLLYGKTFIEHEKIWLKKLKEKESL